MILNSLHVHVCPFIMTKNIAKITVRKFYIFTIEFREIARLNSTGPLHIIKTVQYLV